MDQIEFKEFPKMARLSREMIITEKIDGTNASIHITDDGQMLCGSRTRWITPENDNHGFAKWAMEHKTILLGLGKGTHFGEWWGSGIQRGYGLPKGEKRFSLFNVTRWCLYDQDPQVISESQQGVVRYQERLPSCVGLVPVLYKGQFNSLFADGILAALKDHGSYATPFMNPEGIVVFHVAAGIGFKKTIEHDELPKSLVK